MQDLVETVDIIDTYILYMALVNISDTFIKQYSPRDWYNRPNKPLAIMVMLLRKVTHPLVDSEVNRLAMKSKELYKPSGAIEPPTT